MSKRKRLSNEQIQEMREKQSDTDSFRILSNILNDLDSYSDSSTSNEDGGEVREAFNIKTGFFSVKHDSHSFLP